MSRRVTDGRARWALVVVAAVALAAAGTYQWIWSSIRTAVGARVGASGTALGTVFTLFVVFQAASQFPAGWLRDRYGPRLPLLVGAPFVAAGYAGLAFARTPTEAYLFYSLGGVGAGVVYAVAVNTPVKWFGDRRGLATGVVAMAFSAPNVLVVPLVRSGIGSAFETTLLVLGGGVGLVVLVAALVLRDPPESATAGDLGRSDGPAAAHDATESGATSPQEDGGTTAQEDGGTSAGEDESGHVWRTTVRTWQFWLLYAVFGVANGVGLMLIGKSVSFALGLGLSGGVAAATAALIPLANGAGIVVGGAVSDRIGRVRTIGAALCCCGLALAATTVAGRLGVAPAFVGLAAVAAFFRSPVFSVFPSLVGDYYGAAHASENYGLLYSAKLWAGVGGGTAASALVLAVGWTTAFLLAAGLIGAAGAAAFLLRPPTDPS